MELNNQGYTEFVIIQQKMICNFSFLNLQDNSDSAGGLNQRYFILDCSAISYIDCMGLNILKEVPFKNFHQSKVERIVLT